MGTLQFPIFPQECGSNGNGHGAVRKWECEWVLLAIREKMERESKPNTVYVLRTVVVWPRNCAAGMWSRSGSPPESGIRARSRSHSPSFEETPTLGIICFTWTKIYCNKITSWTSVQFILQLKLSTRLCTFYYKNLKFLLQVILKYTVITSQNKSKSRSPAIKQGLLPCCPACFVIFTCISLLCVFYGK